MNSPSSLKVMAVLPLLAILAGCHSDERAITKQNTEHSRVLSKLGYFDQATNEKLTMLSDLSETNPNKITYADLAWVINQLQSKRIDKKSSAEFLLCSSVLMLKKSVPKDLIPGYRDIGTKMILFNDTPPQVALAGCVILSRTKDPSVIPLMESLRRSSDPEVRSRVERSIKFINS